MNSLTRFTCVLTMTVLTAGTSLPLPADELGNPDLRGADLLPSSTVVYLEVPEPQVLLDFVFDHPLRSRIESHALFDKATKSQPWRNFLTARKVFEVQMGMEWRQAITALSAGGIYAGFDPVSGGFALLVKARDEQTMEKLRSGLLEMLRLGNAGADSAEDQYRGLNTYRMDRLRLAVTGGWLVAVNQPELGRPLLDRLLDDVSGSPPLTTAPSEFPALSGNPVFETAMKSRSADVSIWGFADLEKIRMDTKVQKSLQDQARNPGIELLAGGIQSILRQTPSVTAELKLNSYTAELVLSVPWNSSWVPEERTWFFGPDGNGIAPGLPDVPDTLMTLGVWRDVSEMWLRAGDLFDQNMNDQLAAAESTLTTLFAGRDFAEDILGSFQPQIGLVLTRQNFQQLPQPAIKLPAFALVLELRDPERMTRELRRTFQSMIGFFNVVGAMEGRPQLEMDIRRIGNAELITSIYLPEDDEQDSTTAPIIFNFSPSVGFSGSQVIISSTQQLAEQLIQTPPPQAAPAVVANSYALLNAPMLTQILADNREQLIAQNMLEQGNTRDEAEGQIGLLLELLGYFESLGMQLSHDDQLLKFQIQTTLINDEAAR